MAYIKIQDELNVKYVCLLRQTATIPDTCSQSVTTLEAQLLFNHILLSELFHSLFISPCIAVT